MKFIDKKIEHLRQNPNTTYLKMWFLYILFFFFAGLFFWILELDIHALSWAVFILLFTYLIPITIWVLKCKGQHWAWVIPSMISIGAIIPLLLKNKNKEKPTVIIVKEKDMEILNGSDVKIVNVGGVEIVRNADIKIVNESNLNNE